VDRESSEPVVEVGAKPARRDRGLEIARDGEHHQVPDACFDGPTAQGRRRHRTLRHGFPTSRPRLPGRAGSSMAAEVARRRTFRLGLRNTSACPSTAHSSEHPALRSLSLRPCNRRSSEPVQYTYTFQARGSAIGQHANGSFRPEAIKTRAPAKPSSRPRFPPASRGLPHLRKARAISFTRICVCGESRNRTDWLVERGGLEP
jgi:hypothetical protein